LCSLLLIGVCACGDDAAPPEDASAPDAADGSVDAPAVDAFRPDAGTDTGLFFDAGPDPTGCELLEDAGATDAGDGGPVDFEPPPPTAPALTGPGGPARTFAEDELRSACAHLDGGERDRDHHNTVFMLDGYLWMPWAHEGGVGGLSVFEFDDPCAPVPVATVVHDDMRETHAAGYTWLPNLEGDLRRFMVVTSLTGIQFWDVTDPAAPAMITDMSLPGVVYPDSYARVVMSTFWQAPYVFVGASDNGIFVVDATHPETPELVVQFEPRPKFRVGGVHAIGTRLYVFPSEGTRSAIVDIADPRNPRALPGASWRTDDGTVDRLGRPRVQSAYFAHVSGYRAFYARNLLGGGLMIYDTTDPTRATLESYWQAIDVPANGGYVFVKEDEAFVGLSNHGVVLDISDRSAPSRTARIDHVGDVDTLVPVGNVIAVSVDDGAVPDQATAVQPWSRTPDRQAPRINMVVPLDGETDVALSARVGMTFNEPYDAATLHRGSVYVRPIDDADRPIGPPVDALLSGQEGVVNAHPRSPLAPNTRYEVVVPAGGVQDVSGNATVEAFRSTFRTARCD
jgi:hypothetical protein